jgi:phenylacetate-CoA ligase
VALIWNHEAEAQPRREREALQGARLRETAAWARERVPFYRERLSGVNVRGLADLARLPFTRKTDLRAQYPFGLFAVPLAEVARLHASSGTKGKPTVVGYTAEDLAVWREVTFALQIAETLAEQGSKPADLGPVLRNVRRRAVDRRHPTVSLHNTSYRK